MKKLHFPKIKLFFTIIALSGFLGISACSNGETGMREATASRLATPVFMHERIIPADPCALTAFERVRKPGGNATIYIEGDGLAWSSRRTPSLDPTPVNPVALHLATRDDGPNVIYLARPCQYSKLITPNIPCDGAYWTSKRLSLDVINAMNTALDNIKKRYGLKKMDLVGFSGGAGAAILLAARRTDITSIRTVAGNLDHSTFTAYHGVSPWVGSINPLHIAKKVNNIPQYHFVGEWDEIIPQGAMAKFLRASGSERCIRYSIVREATHEKGWVARWPKMLHEPLDCMN